MSLAGAAVVATDLEPYQMIQDGVNGVLVRPDAQADWVNAISWLIYEPDTRHCFQKEAVKQIHKHHSWWSDDATKPWVDFYTKVAKK